MLRIKKHNILYVVNILKENKIRFAVLRQHENLLNANTSKDLDIIVLEEDKKKLHKLLRKNFYFVDPRLSEFSYLYGVTGFKYYRNYFWDINPIDVCFQLTVKSTNNNSQIVPLDKYIQSHVVKNLNNNIDSDWPILDPISCIVYETSFAIFNKRGCINLLNKCSTMYQDLTISEKLEVEKMINLVFFRFSDEILRALEICNFDDIYLNYIKYKDY